MERHLTWSLITPSLVRIQVKLLYTKAKLVWLKTFIWYTVLFWILLVPVSFVPFVYWLRINLFVYSHMTENVPNVFHFIYVNIHDGDIHNPDDRWHSDTIWQIWLQEYMHLNHHVVDLSMFISLELQRNIYMYFFILLWFKHNYLTTREQSLDYMKSYWLYFGLTYIMVMKQWCALCVFLYSYVIHVLNFQFLDVHTCVYKMPGIHILIHI